MNENIKKLVDAMIAKDASGTESAFQAAMAEKISAKLDDMRQEMSQSMFKTPEAVVEEEEELTEEEFESILSEGELAKAVKAHADAALYHDRFGGKDAKAAVKTAKEKMHSLAKERGIKPSRATKVSNRLINRAYGDDDGVKVKK
jgi:hypothetical protein